MRNRRVLCSVFCVLWIPGFAYAAKEDPFNVDCFFGWGGFYRPMEWTPLEIGIGTTLKEPFAGAIEVAVPQDEQNTLRVSHRFVVTVDLPLRLPLVTKIAYGASRCSLRLTDRNGRSCWRADINLWDFSSGTRAVTPVGQTDLLIGLVGRRTFGVLKLPLEAVSVFADRAESSQGKVYVGDKVPNMVPWDWTGFASLDLLILYDPDWDQMRPDQVKAIVDWIAGGGKALVVLGNLGLPEGLLKVLSLDVAPLRQLVLAPDLLARLQLQTGQAVSVPCFPLGLHDPGAAYRCEVTDANACVFAVMPVGFGRIGVLGFDPAGLGESQASRSSPFWAELIRAILEDPLVLPAAGASSGLGPTETSRTAGRPGQWNIAENQYQIRTIRMAGPATQEASGSQQQQWSFSTSKSHVVATQILGYLQSISQMRPLSIWPILGLLVLLALLIGPVDYLVLKRLDRQPWTWVTSGFWIVAFTVGAYYGVQALRGGSLQLRVVSVLDGIAGTDRAWATHYSGLFAPRSDQYQFEDLAANQWWSGIAPVGTQVYQNPQHLGSRDIYCLQHDGGNLPAALPVNIWTMQYTITEQAIPDLPVQATVRREGDGVRIEVTNLSDAAFDYGFVLLAGRRPVTFGQVAAGASASYSERLRVGPSAMEGLVALGSVFAKDSGLSVQTLFDAYGAAHRSLAMRSYLARGAAVVCVRLDQARSPFRIKDRTCQYHHVEWVRLVVFPEGK